MESIIVLETPDYPKTIDEINQDSYPKVISKSTCLDFNPTSTSLQEKLEFFKSIYGKKVEQEFSWEKHSISRKDRLALIEKELKSISEDNEQSIKDTEEYPETLEEVQTLKRRIEKLKVNMNKTPKVQGKKGLKFAASAPVKEEKISSGIKLEVDISNFREQQRMIELHNQVTELENVIGHWEEPQPIPETLSNLLLKTHFLNENLLEKLIEHSKHLGNDLDSILSNSQQSLAAPDVVQKIERLMDDTYQHMALSKNIPQIIEKLRNFQSIFIKSIEVEKVLNKLENTTDTMGDRISESIESLHEIKTGIDANTKMVSQNIGNLKKRIN